MDLQIYSFSTDKKNIQTIDNFAPLFSRIFNGIVTDPTRVKEWLNILTNIPNYRKMNAVTCALSAHLYDIMAESNLSIDIPTDLKSGLDLLLKKISDSQVLTKTELSELKKEGYQFDILRYLVKLNSVVQI
jgi:hypothetical protein